MAFLIRRLLTLAVTLLITSVAIFTVMEVLPGDPAAVMLGTEARPDTLAALRRDLGLDRPAPLRYLDWMASLADGSMSISYTYRVPAGPLIAERLAVTLPLALLAILLSTAIALPLGVYAAARHNRPGDWGVMAFAQIGVAVPNFWLGLLLILLFSVELGWFSAGGFPGWTAPWASLRALLLPALALALPQAAILARVTRGAVLEVMSEDFVRTARAKGLSRRATLLRHVLRNAMIPVATVLGLQFSFLIAGAIIVETVFTLPGLGRLAFQAVAQRDLIVVQDVVMLLAAVVIVVNFLVDLAYGLLDPRLKRLA